MSQLDNIDLPGTWPGISNAAAREVVAEAWILTHSIPLRRGREYLSDELPHRVFVERDTLRHRLAASGIAQRLVDGPAAFPELVERLPAFSQPLARLMRPRNHRQLTRHLLENLEWYLDPRTAPSLRMLETSSLFLWSVACAVVIPFIGIALGNWLTAPLVIVGIFFLLPIVLIYGNSPLSRKADWKDAYGDSLELIRRAEYYYYLAESYSDADEEAGGAVAAAAQTQQPAGTELAIQQFPDGEKAVSVLRARQGQRH